MAFATLSLLKRILGRFPTPLQEELRRVYLRYQLRRGRFSADEPEFARLQDWVGAGDWVLDIGANVGHYSARLSRLVGFDGRVLAFEPVPVTFQLLASNAAEFAFRNVTLMNVAASDQVGEVAMTWPTFDTGLSNYYQARIRTARGKSQGSNEVSVLSIAVDALEIPGRVTFAKIDVEGYELAVLKGMKDLLEREGPVLVVEGKSEAVRGYLSDLGYRYQDLPGSPNRLYIARRRFGSGAEGEESCPGEHRANGSA